MVTAPLTVDANGTVTVERWFRYFPNLPRDPSFPVRFAVCKMAEDMMADGVFSTAGHRLRRVDVHTAVDSAQRPSKRVEQQGALVAFARRRVLGYRWRSERMKNVIFDWWYRTDTHLEAALVNHGLSTEDAQKANNVYRPFWRKEFYQAIGSLGVDPRQYTFIDVGSGKGKLLLLGSRLGFPRIVGVEHAPGLHKIAVRNIARFKIRTRCWSNIESIYANVIAWQLPDGPAVYFLFNAFDAETTAEFLSRCDAHSTVTGAPTHLIYGNLRDVSERIALLERMQNLKLRVKTQHYVCFSNV
jgi:hypothetical protein